MPGRRSRPFRSARLLTRARGFSSPFSATPLTASSSSSTTSVPVPATITTNASNDNYVTQTTSSANVMGDASEVEGTSSSPASDVKDMIRSVERRVQSLEDKTVKLTTVIKELSDLMKKHCKSSFTIKGSAFEVKKNKRAMMPFNCCGNCS